ncbi:MAG: nucleoside 2-deoxyribosyltransferase [Clostridia bacterium]|nr:nucleoside 2-deoxyribosyltransferase [Clostridia bacterium]
MKIYFAGSIRGGRKKAKDYKKIVDFLKKYGDVLTTHVADESLTSSGESNITTEEIFSRDVEWLTNCDILVADVTIPSLGVGYEIGHAVSIGKKVVALYDESENITLSAMISGNDNVNVIKYTDIEELENCYIKKLILYKLLNLLEVEANCQNFN